LMASAVATMSARMALSFGVDIRLGHDRYRPGPKERAP
jgi:hypothetical protein